MAYNPSQGLGSLRRSSYASVAAGTTGIGPAFHQPGRSISHSLSTATGSSYPPPSHHTRRPSRGMDNEGGLYTGPFSTSWGGSRSASQPFGYNLAHASSSGIGGFGLDPPMPPFFVPSYLAGSRYAEKLEDTYKARLALLRDAHNPRSPTTSNPGSLSTSASSANLQKMVPSHRGMTHDIVERTPPAMEEPVAPLPTRWNEQDKHKGADVRGDGLQVHFSSQAKTSGHSVNEEASAVRADAPMPRAAGIYYFECQVQAKQKEVLIGIGFCGPKTPLERLPGWEQESWAYHGDDGCIFNSHSSGKPYGGHKYGPHDTVGCGVNFQTGQAFFTRNGVHLGTAFSNIRGERLYPCVGLKKPGEYVITNFGQSPFVFDIDGLMKQEKNQLRDLISMTSVTHLQPPLDERELIQKLVAQYLAMDGYVETARAFAREVRDDAVALATGSGDGTAAPDLEPVEDMDAVNRQQIRAAILEGDIDRALKKTKAYYPSVLQDHENIFFKLKCRKYIEMIRRLSDLYVLQNAPSSSPAKKPGSNGHHHASDEFGDVFSHQMELDDQLQLSVASSNGHSGGGAADRMDTDLRPGANIPWNNKSGGLAMVDASPLSYNELVQETLAYGQELNQLFKDDPRREVKKALEDTFSLIAYANPRDSPFAGLLEERERGPVAEELNSAILVSLGKASSSGLERLIQQTEVLVDDLAEDGGVGALVNVRGDYMRRAD